MDITWKKKDIIRKFEQDFPFCAFNHSSSKAQILKAYDYWKAYYSPANATHRKSVEHLMYMEAKYGKTNEWPNHN